MHTFATKLLLFGRLTRFNWERWADRHFAEKDGTGNPQGSVSLYVWLAQVLWYPIGWPGCLDSRATFIILGAKAAVQTRCANKITDFVSAQFKKYYEQQCEQNGLNLSEGHKTSIKLCAIKWTFEKHNWKPPWTHGSRKKTQLNERNKIQPSFRFDRSHSIYFKISIDRVEVRDKFIFNALMTFGYFKFDLLMRWWLDVCFEGKNTSTKQLLAKPLSH